LFESTSQKGGLSYLSLDTAALFQALGGGWLNRQDNDQENRQ